MMRVDLRWGKIWIALIAVVFIIQLLTLTPLWTRLERHTPSFVTSMLHRPVQDSNSDLHLPLDFNNLPPSEKACEDEFGASYLTKLTSRQLPYCELDSPSRLQCFRTNRTDNLWVSDSLCIAQGVEIGKVDQTPLLQCLLRNFTQEALVGNKEAEGVQDIESMHSYWFGTGVHDTLYPWRIHQDSESQCSKKAANRKWILWARREGNVNVFHKLAELWQATMTMDVVRMATDPSSGLPYLTPEDDVNVQVMFDDNREEPLDDWWTVVTGNTPLRQNQLDPGCYGNVIIPLAGSSSPFWTLLMQKPSDHVCTNKILLDTFLRRLFQHLRIEPRPHSKRNPVITIIDRQTTRKIFKIKEYTENLRQKYPQLTVNLVDFASISLREQVFLVQNTDILVGHHGAGMAHVLFLPEQSSVIEIFPPVFSPAGFGQLSKMRGLVHFAAHSLWIGDWQKESNTSTDIEPPPFDEAGWQSEEWAYMREKDFQAFVDAALRSQSYDGVTA